tara:strand:+ start:4057 stop:6423 length:2367 start_codon:yes stop_codon:yes gene_type:complete
MKISLKWLNDFVSFSYSPKELEEKLTDLGLECNIVSSKYNFTKDVVLGKVISVKKHPNADRLNLCDVDVGDKNTLSIVCGAPNVKENILVPVALVGAIIGDEKFKILKSKIRGEISYGMICSGKELGLNSDHDGIMVFNSKKSLGTPIIDIISKDTLLDIDLTPNRGDCLGHLGVAREVSILNNQKVKLKKINISSDSFSIKDLIEVNISDTNDCSRYCARIVKNVKVSESPNWLKEKLNSIGQKSINNIVDVANYILHDLGHPLHTFDLDSLDGKSINVRYAKKNEKITALDSNVYSLSKDDLIIADSKKPIAIAGVIGGLNSHVTNKTKNILIESAYFNPIPIRKTSKVKGLSTEASKRFERDTDFEILEYAMNKAAFIIQQIAGGVISKDFIDEKSREEQNCEILFDVIKCNSFLGSSLKSKEIKSIFNSLSIDCSNGVDSFKCSIPSYRNDLYREIDLYEEVARVYGYNNFKSTDSFSIPYQSLQKNESISKKLRFILSNRFNEHYSNSLYSKEDVSLFDDKTAIKILNPLNNDMSYVRNNLLAGLLKTISYNERRGHDFLKFFEIGSCSNYAKDRYNKSKESNELGIIWTVASRNHWKHPEFNDIYSIKSEVKHLFEMLNVRNINLVVDPNTLSNFNVFVNDSINIGHLVSVNDKILKNYNVKNNVWYCNLDLDKLSEAIEIDIKYNEVTNFPSISRDISILIDKNFSYDEIIKVIDINAGEFLINANLVDIYTDKNISAKKHSLLFSLRFGANNRTLKDKEVDKSINNIINSLKNKFKVTQR